jgi:hypothetical protein
VNGLSYDYTNQAWIQNDKYVPCNHPATLDCRCFGKLHAGETAPPIGDNIARPFAAPKWPTFGKDWR